jgi:hypothetical protein
MEVSAWIMAPLVIGGFCIVFGGIWFGVIALLAFVGGWPRLARRFAASGPADGERFSAVTGSMGRSVLYQHAWTVTITNAGVHVALWRLLAYRSPPLFIPWSQIAGIDELKTSKGMRLTALRLRNESTPIGMGGRAAERVRERYLEAVRRG